jgi:uncharacterized repeat protein (TIGR04076 family)
MPLLIEVVEIRGKCPVYHVGESIVVKEGYILDLAGRSAVCMHSLASIFPYYVALSRGVNAQELGLSKRGAASDKAYVQCLDPCHITGGGTVIFAIGSMPKDIVEG